MTKARDHGGGLDAAIARYGGTRAQWLDLSTGINPMPYPVGPLPPDAWTALPDADAMTRLERAARAFWHVPDSAEVVIAPGASALIARIPTLFESGSAFINNPTYNEHEAAFRAHDDWHVTEDRDDASLHVFVHPNNGARALEDAAWTLSTRERLAADSARLDALVGAQVVGGTDLFRLYDVGCASAWQEKLARGYVWSRVFPYSDRWLRLGLPASDRWAQLEAAL